MSTIRIPVSLKLDTEDEFYLNFVAPKRDDRLLSDFILSIMRAYHENQHIKESVDVIMDANSPFATIRKQIERINIEHTKTVMSTSMLSQHIQMSKEKFETSSEVAESGDLVADGESGKVLGRLEALEKSVPDITEKLNTVLQLLQSGVLGATTPATAQSSAPVHSTVQSEPKVEETTQMGSETAQKVVFEHHAENSASQPVKKEAPTFEQPTILPSAQSSTPEITLGDGSSQTSGAPTLTIIGSDEPAEEELKSNRPASFGKLRSSIGKKEA